MAMRESTEDALLRWQKLGMVQKHYPTFRDFMADMMVEIGFSATDMQKDIADYLQFGPQYLMVQAQRGEAKTTITAMFAVYCLIHDPRFRVLIVSAGGKTANEIATLIQRIITTVDILECMRPDANNGDRTSVEAFDLHYSLKGIDKSPSVACIGITGNLPGKRADLLIADDIESPKNSLTAANREMLLLLSLEFTSICSNGRIIYLGTPQTGESIYNTLEGRGFTVRIWPGRYPTMAEMENYGNNLAPYLIRKMVSDPLLRIGGGLTGNKGQPTDPVLLGEESLCKKEMQGVAYFQLNYMLNTALSDAQRYPLKLENIIVLKGDGRHFPDSIVRGMSARETKAFTSSGIGFQLALPHAISETLNKPQGIHMQIDPAGGGKNGDETAWAVTAFYNGNVFVLSCGGMQGGSTLAVLEKLADVAALYQVNQMSIEKNMGYGLFAQVFLPILRKKWKGNIDEPFVTGQKEVRIIGSLEPVMNRGSLIFMESVIEEDSLLTEHYAPGTKVTYSLFHQISKLTNQKKCLAHDDRVDALEGSVRYWSKYMAIDEEEKAKRDKLAALAEWAKDPIMHGRFNQGAPSRGGSSLFDKYRR